MGPVSQMQVMTKGAHKHIISCALPFMMQGRFLHCSRQHNMAGGDRPSDDADSILSSLSSPLDTAGT